MQLYALSVSTNNGRFFVTSEHSACPRINEAKLFPGILSAIAFRRKHWSEDEYDCKLVELELNIGKEMY
jgi:hypothetical protein